MNAKPFPRIEPLEVRIAPAFGAVFDLSSLNGGNGFRLDGISPGDESGWSVSGAGDVNGDGFDDVIVGARSGESGALVNSGEAYVVFGKAAGFSASFALSSLDGTNGFRIDAIESNDRLGYSVSGAGDFNGDGFDDLIVSADNANPGGKADAGEIYLIFGKAGGFAASLNVGALNGTNGFRIPGLDASSRSVSGAGDINNDGFDDVIVGGEFASGPGESYVLFGRGGVFPASFDLATLNGTNGFRLAGIDSGDRFGGGVSGAGDVNGDGFDDLLVGAYRDDPGGHNDAGESYVIFGKATGFGATFNPGTLDGTNGFRLDGIDSNDFTGSRKGISAAD